MKSDHFTKAVQSYFWPINCFRCQRELEAWSILSSQYYNINNLQQTSFCNFSAGRNCRMTPGASSQYLAPLQAKPWLSGGQEPHPTMVLSCLNSPRIYGLLTCLHILFHDTSDCSLVVLPSVCVSPTVLNIQ